MFDVVIPAHNEAAVIGRCLKAVCRGLPDDAAVVVVTNGCTDDTAARVTAWPDPRVTGVDVAAASKRAALNAGDAHCEGGGERPGRARFYVDADVTVDGGDLTRVARLLDDPAAGVEVAAPQMRVELDGRPWSVQAFYRVWTALPYVREAMVGSGVFALSAAGRARFETFPDITADDAYVRLHFKAAERRVVSDASFLIQAPRRLRDVIKIKTRSHFGNLELRERFPELWANEEGGAGGGLAALARRPGWWPALAVYLVVKVVSRRRAEARLRRGERDVWERDESTRGPAAAQSTGTGVAS